MFGRGHAWVSVFVYLLATAVHGQTPSFRGIGFLDLNGARSEAYGISDDGRIVAGFSKIGSSFQGFRWTAGTGMEGIGWLDSADRYSDAVGISHDGTTLVGEGRFGANMVAIRWQQQSGVEPIAFPLGGTASDAMAASADGSVITGFRDLANGEREGFRWSEATGLQILPHLAGSNSEQPNAISGDGSIVVGTIGGHDAFYWDQANGMRSFMDLSPGSFRARSAWAMTADAKWVVGIGNELGEIATDEAFRWSMTGGYEKLSAAPDGTIMHRAMGVSADGSVIVGDNYDTQEAFIWRDGYGAQRLKDFLEGLGVSLDGWSLTFATAVSADGRTIVGAGFDPAGQKEAWIATVPEPSVQLILTMIAGLIYRRRRRQISSHAKRIQITI